MRPLKPTDVDVLNLPPHGPNVKGTGDAGRDGDVADSGAERLALARDAARATLHELAVVPAQVAAAAMGLGGVVAGVVWASGLDDLPIGVGVVLLASAVAIGDCARWARRAPHIGGQAAAGVLLFADLLLTWMTDSGAALPLGLSGALLVVLLGTLAAPPGQWRWGPFATAAWLGALLTFDVSAEPPLFVFPPLILVGTSLLLARVTRRLADNERAMNQALEDLVRQSEAASKANRAKSEFLTSMSHELRTPLNAIIGYGELILDSDPEPAVGADVQRITQAGHHLLDLVNDVLDMAKIESGRLDLEWRSLPLRPLLDELRGVAEGLAPKRGNRLVWVVEPSVPESVVGDELRLRQVLLNLLGNALKFTEGGEVRVTAAGASDGWTFEVDDDGPGIDDETLATLFTPFAQGRRRGLRVEGTGLGLSISHELVRRMGGALTVRSAVGEGSVFTVRLPV